MKFYRTTISLIAWIAVAVGTGTLRAETTKEAVDRLWNAYPSIDNKFFDKKYWLLSQAVAKEQGIAVIKPVLMLSKDWKGEEGLFFMPLIECLPRDQVIPLLQHYKKNGTAWERRCADDFLTEIDSEEFKRLKKDFLVP